MNNKNEPSAKWVRFQIIRGVTCLKFYVCNCGNVVNACMHKIPKREYLQIA